MREVRLPDSELPVQVASFLACLATILELPLEQLPQPAAGEDAATGWTLSRWLGGLPHRPWEPSSSCRSRRPRASRRTCSRVPARSPAAGSRVIGT
jgi:hypothetical protein